MAVPVEAQIQDRPSMDEGEHVDWSGVRGW